MPINLQRMCLDWGRKPEYLEERGGHANSAEPGIEPPNLEGSMYIEKSRGPKTEPCGTPYSTGITLDISPFKSTKWYRSDRPNYKLALLFVSADGEQPQRKIFHHWCALKKDEGACKAIKDRFYFNIETFRCEPFEYGGCGGNENNFKTLEECEEMCLEKDSKSPCHLVDEPGPCRGLVPRYFFDSKVNQCRRFFYGGCFGNANNFRSLKECKNRCQPGNDTEEPQSGPKAEEKTEYFARPVVISEVHKEHVSHTQPLKLPMKESNMDPELAVPDYCLSSFDKGDCEGTERRFFYNSQSNRCQTFKYSGCGGNKNNFVFKRMCMKTCMKGMSLHSLNALIQSNVQKCFEVSISEYINTGSLGHR
ncbi:hypothetical protein QTP86_031416, partial [Hemibagrus guttatus]